MWWRRMFLTNGALHGGHEFVIGPERVVIALSV